MARELVLIPVYNEEKHIKDVLLELRRHYAGDVLFVNDGSQDASAKLLQEIRLLDPDLFLLTNQHNMGYGASLGAGFEYAVRNGYEFLVTMDCDWQHEPSCVPLFLREVRNSNVVSGSRYIEGSISNGSVPSDREAINRQVTALVNEITGFVLTDAFCGFKAYQVQCFRKLELTEHGYAFPLQFWLQAAHFGLTIKELPVPRIYFEISKAFPGTLQDPENRLAYYLAVVAKERARWGT